VKGTAEGGNTVKPNEIISLAAEREKRSCKKCIYQGAYSSCIHPLGSSVIFEAAELGHCRRFVSKRENMDDK